MNINKTECMCFKQRATTTTSSRPLKLVDKFTYLGSNISSTESVVNICLVTAWTAINRLSITWKSDLSDKIKWDFFQAVAVSIPLNGGTTWILTKCLKEKLNENYPRMLRTILKIYWMQYSTKQQLYSHLPPISQTIQVRQIMWDITGKARMNS